MTEMERALSALRGVLRAIDGKHPLGHDLIVNIRRIVLAADGKLPVCTCTPCSKARTVKRGEEALKVGVTGKS